MTNKMGKRIGLLVITTLLCLMMAEVGETQFEGIRDALFGPVSLVKGMKNVMGGVWAADKVHHKCLQRTICDEFSDEVVNMTEVEDPVKRSIVLVPKVIKRRGRLRFIGDFVANSLSFVSSKIGLNKDRLLRKRQGAPNGLLGKAVGMAMDTFSSIPVQQMTHVMDFAADSTNVVERKGNVYPLIKSSTMGYMYGTERGEDFDGVCAQMAPDCDDNWKHIETINMYEGGALSRVVADRSSLTRDTRGGADDPLVWNTLSVDEVANPRVVLCKTSRFLEKLNEKMGGDGVVKERYGPEDFDKTCDPAMLEPEPQTALPSGDVPANSTDANLPLSDIEVLDVRSNDRNETSSLASLIFDDKSNNDTDMDELPLIVVEGLAEAEAGISEEQHVENVFTKMKLIEPSQHFVRTAIRLPMKPGGRSLVMVELDALEQEQTLLRHQVMNTNNSNTSTNVSVRRAKYRELWKFLRQTNTIASLIQVSRKEQEKKQDSSDNFQDEPK